MKVAELLEQRRQHWRELEGLTDRLQVSSRRTVRPEQATRFAALYRSACADLALAEAYQLPTPTVEYLHRLVGRAHNQLYRARMFDLGAWTEMLLTEAPQRIFRDRCVQVAFALFWGVFLLSAWLAYDQQRWPGLGEQMLGEAMIEQLTTSFADPLSGRPWGENFFMAAFYISHNTGIGLACFAWCLAIVPGLFTLVYNAAVLGAAFGYMGRPEVAAGRNFFEFVTAHGPFELTAIALSAGAGLRLGVSWIATGGLTRIDSLRRGAREAMPPMSAAIVLFFLAALLEGFLSPSSAPYWTKAGAAAASSALLAFYFVVLGFPRRLLGAA